MILSYKKLRLQKNIEEQYGISLIDSPHYKDAASILQIKVEYDAKAIDSVRVEMEKGFYSKISVSEEVYVTLMKYVKYEDKHIEGLAWRLLDLLPSNVLVKKTIILQPNKLHDILEFETD